jgi:hypothetical protein
VLISWIPGSSGGSAITGYRVLIRQSDETTYSLDLTNCDGASASVISSTSCLVPILALRSAPFSLAWGSSVYVQVVAYNVYGDSATSAAGNGAIILTIPDSPVNLEEVTASRTASQLSFKWTPGA